MDSLYQRYEVSKTTPYNINEHVDDLRMYASKCTSVLELGVESCTSSWGLLTGLAENERPSKRMVSVDITRYPAIDEVKDVARQVGVSYEFVQGNDLTVDFYGETFDLTFIDTWHVYGQLKRELAKFAPMTRKYIVMHDTAIDKDVGESIRMGMNIQEQSKISGIPEDEIRQGLGRAIEEFLAQDSRWRIERVKKNNNGLTVLSRFNRDC